MNNREPSIDEMVSDLIGGGWTKIHSDLWEAPYGGLYRGPHKAWHIWAGSPMCDPPNLTVMKHIEITRPLDNQRQEEKDGNEISRESS